MGVCRTDIGSVERGEWIIPLQTLDKIADSLKADPRQFLDDLPTDEIRIALKLGPYSDVVGHPHRLLMRSTVIESPRCQYPCDVVVQRESVGSLARGPVQDRMASEYRSTVHSTVQRP